MRGMVGGVQAQWSVSGSLTFHRRRCQTARSAEQPCMRRARPARHCLAREAKRWRGCGPRSARVAAPAAKLAVLRNLIPQRVFIVERLNQKIWSAARRRVHFRRSLTGAVESREAGTPWRKTRPARRYCTVADHARSGLAAPQTLPVSTNTAISPNQRMWWVSREFPGLIEIDNTRLIVTALTEPG